MKKITSLLLIIVLAITLNANTGHDALIGVWEPSHGKARIKIEKIGTKYFGKIVWLKEPLNPETQQKKTDKNNPEESLRNKPVLGLRVLKDFEGKEKNTWENGTIYDPENGSTYNCKIEMKDNNTLEIRGYIGVPTFGRTDVWKRMQ